MTMHESNRNRDLDSELPSRPREGYHGHNSKDLVRDLADSIRQNPTAAALISMGVFWLLVGGNRTSLFGGTAGSSEGSGAISTTLSNIGRASAKALALPRQRSVIRHLQPLHRFRMGSLQPGVQLAA